MNVCDVLITDYSSSIWDYSFLFKPCFLYAKDLTDYQKERNFYVDINDWPFDFAKNNEELNALILNFNKEELIDKIKKHHLIMGSYEEGKACNYIYDFIKKEVINNEKK